jgi:Hemerythrin HHE cation binding domain/Polyketide cyclase / dehydrase and lipid transport
MKTEPSVPADTRMMGIVHSALRRDLSRATGALSREPFPGDAQRVAIAQHMQAMMVFLHLHHSGEDDWLWPTMRRLNPAASDVLDRMDADHRRIAPHMEKVTEAAAAYENSATGREVLLQTLSDLRGTLDPHLRREEDEMMPIVSSTLTATQWDGWEWDYYVKTKSKKELGLEGHWLIDGGDRTVYNHVVGTVNPVLRFVLLRVFGPKYQQECAIRWGADVPVGPKLSEVATTEQPEIIGPQRRPWRTRGEVSVRIEAPPERVYDLVADLGSAPTRSDEVQACLWLEGPPPGTVGSRFRGRNRAGLIRWSRICEVVTATRGEQFAFRTVPEQLDPTRRDSCVWGYHFEPDGTGTRITHYYTLVQPPQPWLLMLYGILMPHHRDARPALRHTLEQLRVTAETWGRTSSQDTKA